MTGITFTSTTGSGYLETDHTQVKGGLEDGTLDINTANIDSTGITNTGSTSTAGVTSSDNIIVNAQAYSATNTLSDGANIAVDCDNANVFTVTLAGNRTLDNPTNLKNGATYLFVIKQDATGGREITFDTVYKFEGGTATTLSTDANAVDIIGGVSDGTNVYITLERLDLK